MKENATNSLRGAAARALALVLLTGFSLHSQAAPVAPEGLLGDWVLNDARTQEVQPEQPESRNWLPKGRISTNVSVGGIPLPRTGGNVPPVSSTAANDPPVLRIKELNISSPEAGQVELSYGSLQKEKLHHGDYRGARTGWTKERLRTRYESTQRKVEHRYELQDDASLLVTTRIKAKGAKRRTYLQVFERPQVATDTPDAAP